MRDGISLGKGIFWVLVWFGFMLLYTTLDLMLWRKTAKPYGEYLNLLSIVLCMVGFLALLTGKNHFKINLFGNITFPGILLAAGCAVIFYFALDKGIDPVLAKIFPESEEGYQQALQSLRQAPVASFLQVCVLAPVIEEILMRGFLLGGLSVRYEKWLALLVSSLLFALLHFNMVQTLSAFVCGVVLGILYLYTGSVFCCILTHMGYNLISYMTMILPPGQ